jgi:hypothetical protein
MPPAARRRGKAVRLSLGSDGLVPSHDGLPDKHRMDVDWLHGRGSRYVGFAMGHRVAAANSAAIARSPDSGLGRLVVLARTAFRNRIRAVSEPSVSRPISGGWGTLGRLVEAVIRLGDEESRLEP